jgi:glycosyltransferase involved in cell wall biosynthesis
METKGSILYIGVSYYNNWYLSRALRRIGWNAEVLFSSAEGTEQFIHGTDYYLHEYQNWDGQYDQLRFEFLKELLYSYVKAAGNKRATGKLPKVFLRQKWLVKILGRLIPAFIIKSLDSRWFPLAFFRKLYLFFLLSTPDTELLKKLILLFLESTRQVPLPELKPLFDVLDHYDILHFTSVQNLRYFYFFNPALFGAMPIGWDIDLLRMLGKKIVYSNTGCLDGVTQSSFRKWKGPEVICDICIWQNRPDVCSDERNRTWGELRNRLTDYQINLGGNHVDFNDDPRVHEVPEFYCLDTEFWQPDLPIPEKYRLSYPPGTIKIYHAVGNYDLRTAVGTQKNLKCTHIYVPLIERLKSEGYPVELIFAKDIPNTEVRFYQAQADIVVDMLTFGFFGANVREAMMLGIPAVCYLRLEWLEIMHSEIPEYVDELPVISATPDTIHDVLVDLIQHPEKRAEIGRRGREFAKKWHSAEAGARRFDQIYSALLKEPDR